MIQIIYRITCTYVDLYKFCFSIKHWIEYLWVDFRIFIQIQQNIMRHFVNEYKVYGTNLLFKLAYNDWM